MSRALRTLTLGVAALCALLAGVKDVSAQDSPVLDQIIETGVLRVGMSGNQPPYNAVSRDGSMIGLDVDLANTIAVAMGVELNIEQMPFPQLLPALEAGDLDLVMSGVSITAERARTVSFVGPYTMSGKSILTNSTALATIEAAGQINRADLRLAALANSTSQQFIEDNLPESQFVPVSDYDEAVRMVQEDEVDALVADMAICILAVMRHPSAGFATLNQPLTIEPIGIVVPASDGQLRNVVQNYVTALEGMGLLEELRKKWLDDGSWVAALP